MLAVRCQSLLFVLLIAGLSGCSSPSSATISGRVTAEGKDVTAGSIVISPVAAPDVALPGKPGLADIRPDGTYSLQLEPGADGLAKQFIIGFTPPAIQMTEATKDTVVPYLGMIPKQTTVDVKPGNNVIDIELIQTPKKAASPDHQ